MEKNPNHWGKISAPLILTSLLNNYSLIYKYNLAKIGLNFYLHWEIDTLRLRLNENFNFLITKKPLLN